MSFQQVFPSSSNSVHNVENLLPSCAKSIPALQNPHITLPLAIAGFPYVFTEIVGKNGHPVRQNQPGGLFLLKNL